MVFADFECYPYDWLCVMEVPNEEERIFANDWAGLKSFYEDHSEDIWVFYNGRHYDQYILKAIILEMDMAQIWKLSTFLIDGGKGWQFSSLFKSVQLYMFDCMHRFNSLKQLEGFMGHDIKESSVPFNINRPLTPEEIEETIKYCRHDVEEMIDVFIANIDDFNAHMSIINEFKLGLNNLSKTQAQLVALALGCEKHTWNDEWDISLLPCIQIKKYKEVVDWYSVPENYNEKGKQLTIDVAGVPHTFGLGGLHGAPDHPIHVDDGLIVHVDVNSYYPSLMIEWDLLTRNAKDKAIYKKIYDKRLALKKAGKKKEQAPYKIILNGTFGIGLDEYSLAYDPRRSHEVTINGQLLVLDLLEHLEGHCDIIQSNTDGLIVRIEDTDEAWNTLDDICYEWESRSRMTLGFDIIKEIYQKDVNNYLWIDRNGDIETKGAYIKKLSRLDYDLPIVNKAMVDYMLKKIPVERTINEADKLIDFQKIVKLSAKYEAVYHKGLYVPGKTFRVFASTHWNDNYIGKRKAGNSTIEKFANTPDHCFIENGNIEDAKASDYPLDKNYYIEITKKRLEDFGVKSDVRTLQRVHSD